MGTARRQYTDEFKREAVGLLASSGRPLSQIAQELGIAASRLRVWQNKSGASAERGPAPRRGPKAHRQGGGPAGGDCLCEPTGGPRPLDAEPLGRCDRQAHRSPKLVARDRAPTLGRERSQAVAPRHVVHSPGNMSPGWRMSSTSMPRRPIPSDR